MSFFDRMSTGWTMSMKCFSVLRKNKQLIVFPLLSTLSLIVVAFSFIAFLLVPNGWDVEQAVDRANPMYWVAAFLFYLVNYFIIIFFNMALVHCVRLYFQGGNPTVGAGLSFSMSRLGVIFGWASVAATVGLFFKMLQEGGGKVGEIVAAILGIVWSIMTFFVIPVIAYENVGPIAAIKRSSSIMKEKWGESVTASFSFGLVQLLGFFCLVVPLFLIGAMINVVAGIVLGVVGLFILGSIISAAQTIFISAIYHKLNNEPAPDFNDQTIDGLFMKKESNGFFGK
ncbi:MAG TPA: DUF6159 family protein [Flavobacteriales bacterium]|nr:DUF6159 family protein [Flavobacteriales bacterium]